MKADSSSSKKVGSTVILDAAVMRLNKLNVTRRSSTLYSKTCVMLTQCWFNVGQPSDMPVQYQTNTGSMSRICWVIPLIDQSRPCERYGLVNTCDVLHDKSHA